MAAFDYTAGAGLFPCKANNRTTRIRYKRFDSAAEAVRFAIEDMPGAQLRGCVLEVDNARFEGADIRVLYDARDYPLLRREQ